MKSLKAGVFGLNWARRLFFLCLLILAGLSGTLYAQEQQAVLIKGNEWRTGIPGFGSNTFSALFGEYQVETAATVTGSFIVRASREPLQFTAGNWQPWPGLDNAMQRNEGDSLLVGIPFDSPNNMGFWTIVFQFSQGPSGMDAAGINRLIRAWIRRFDYFFALVKTFSDISLPAVVEF